jgi:antitoxin component of RelBE/YafQ-DinJ toxin-antitoxin module
MMGYLRELSRKREQEPKTQPVSTRLTDHEFQEFSKLCSETGYSISEALRILIQQEIKTSDDQLYTNRIHENTESKQINTESKLVNTYSSSTSTIVSKPSTTVNRTIRTGTAQRFTTTEWNVDDYLPCPICGGWVSSSNFSRHAKGHGVTTQEIFTKHKAKADEMVRIRKSTS